MSVICTAIAQLVELKFGEKFGSTSGGSCGLDTRESQNEAAINQSQQQISVADIVVLFAGCQLRL